MLSSILAENVGVQSRGGEMRHRVLLIAGTRDTAAVRQFLSGYVRVDVEDDIRSTILSASGGVYDAIIVDSSRGRSGDLEFLPLLRRNCDLPVIVLAGPEPGDRIAALHFGADDCMSTPCNLLELAARLQAVLRRYRRVEGAGEVIEIRPVRIDPGSRSAWVNGRPIELTSTEYVILETLMRAAGRVVARERLIWTVRQRESAGFDRTLDVHVARLRTKIGRPSPIRTVRGEGYLFCREPAAA